VEHIREQFIRILLLLLLVVVIVVVVVVVRLYSPLLGLGRFFCFLSLYTFGRNLWTGDQPVARPQPTHRTTQTQNKRIQYRRPRPERDSDPRSQCSSERIQFML
jgi:hypothetical protein